MGRNGWGTSFVDRDVEIEPIPRPRDPEHAHEKQIIDVWRRIRPDPLRWSGRGKPDLLRADRVQQYGRQSLQFLELRVPLFREFRGWPEHARRDRIGGIRNRLGSV